MTKPKPTPTGSVPTPGRDRPQARKHMHTDSMSFNESNLSMNFTSTGSRTKVIKGFEPNVVACLFVFHGIRAMFLVSFPSPTSLLSSTKFKTDGTFGSSIDYGLLKALQFFPCLHSVYILQHFQLHIVTAWWIVDGAGLGQNVQHVKTICGHVSSQICSRHPVTLTVSCIVQQQGTLQGSLPVPPQPRQKLPTGPIRGPRPQCFSRSTARDVAVAIIVIHNSNLTHTTPAPRRIL